jgi:hypothetical protein
VTLHSFPAAVPPPLLGLLSGHAHDYIASREPDEVIGRGVANDSFFQRWYLLRKNVIPGIENLYLHRFLRSDLEDVHDHPWSNASLVISGQYVEWVDSEDWTDRQTRNAGDIVIRSPEDRHAIIGVTPGTLTLFATGPKVRDWGFWELGEFIPWQSYRAWKDGAALIDAERIVTPDGREGVML